MTEAVDGEGDVVRGGGGEVLWHRVLDGMVEWVYEEAEPGG